jgi:hypothetical protein
MPPGLGGGKFGDGKAVAPVEEVAEKGGRRADDWGLGGCKACSNGLSSCPCMTEDEVKAIDLGVSTSVKGDKGRPCW